MIEVDYSKPPVQLRIDAEWWLVESKGHTSTVIIVLVADNPTLDIKIWQLRPNNRPQTRSSPNDIPPVTQQIHIDAAGVVTPIG